jgi:hypothetical protein
MAKDQQAATSETATDAAQPAADAQIKLPSVSGARSGHTHTRAHRFAILAAMVALAACLGAMIGSAGTTAAARLMSGGATEKAMAEESRVLRENIAQLAAEVSALKASIEASSTNANIYFTKIVGRLERAAAETTGSIPSAETKPTKPAESKDVSKPAIVGGWVVRDVYGGRALLQHRYALYEVERGSDIPGVGRVETIKRQDGRWVVVTPKGLITSSR